MSHDPLKPAWFYTLDQETYHGPYESRELAIVLAWQEGDIDESIYGTCEVGQGTPIYLGRLVDADWLLDLMRERAYEDGGESWADQLDFGKNRAPIDALGDALEATIHTWARQHNVPLAWYQISQTETVQRNYCVRCWEERREDEIIKCPKCAESYCCTTCRLCQGCKDNER